MGKILIILSLMVAAVQSGKAAAILRVEHLNPGASIGSVVNFDVTVSGAVDLFGWQLDLSFSPSVLLAQTQTEGSFLAAGGTTIFLEGTVDNSSGTVANIAGLLGSAIAGVSGDGALMSADFLAISTGSSQVAITNIFLIDSQGNDIAFTVENSSVDVAAPEPDSVLLAFGALAALCAFSLRRGSQLFRYRSPLRHPSPNRGLKRR